MLGGLVLPYRGNIHHAGVLLSLSELLLNYQCKYSDFSIEELAIHRACR
jgi:hypothetical protein